MAGLSPMERLESQAQSGNPDSPAHKQRPRWVTEGMWGQCQHLDAHLPAYDKICRSLMSQPSQWKQFEYAESPYDLMSRPFEAKEGGQCSKHSGYMPLVYKKNIALT